MVAGAVSLAPHARPYDVLRDVDDAVDPCASTRDGTSLVRW